MKIIVGLGNPGEKYQNTRHNLGFAIAERFLKNFKSVNDTFWEDSKKFKADIVITEWKPKHGDLEKIILVKPKTYMNNSGIAVSLISSFYKVNTSDIWVIHDEVDLPLGGMKIRFGGGSAGHKGIQSVIEKVGTDKFWRFRMGIGNKNSELGVRKKRQIDDYVLGEFRGSEKGKVRELIKKGVKAIETALEEDLESAMNKFNTK